jgi:SAM-dependent methyltransferase
LTPRQLFGAVPDNEWKWLNIEGVDRCSFLASYLPSLPADVVQRSISASSGKTALAEGFEQYHFFKQLYETHRSPSPVDHSRALDFGCGWGRLIRFFLRDIDPENLCGVDVNEAAIAVCRETNRWCRFDQTPTLPPTDMPNDSFDLVYAWSVFSHLSEEAHERWLSEFARLLRPGGVLLLTTLPRGFIESAAAFAEHDPETLPVWQRQAAACFSPSEEWLAAYDRGEFCYCAIRPNLPHFGFTCIPERYVRTVWSRYFVVREYIERSGGITQDVIVCAKQ